jgi:hypothetical protein
VRRIVASLLVVASPLVTAVVPVGATEAQPAGPAVLPAAPVVIQTPAVLTPTIAVAPPAAPAIVATPAAPAVPGPTVAHRAVKAVRAKGPSAGVSDDVYAARLQADLCRARQIFCGLDHGGRYLAR